MLMGESDSVRVWWQTPIRCPDCQRIYFRPSLSSRPCSWCQRDKG